MEERDNHDAFQSLPPCAAEYIALVVRKVRYRKKVRRDIAAELTAHFEDELQNCTTDAERDARARQVIEGFGDPKLLGVLCRRAKKRCRPMWARTLSGMLRTVGAFLLMFSLYTAWFVHGKPKPTTDYLPPLNALTPAVPVQENAWTYYQRALHLYVPPAEAIRQKSWFSCPLPPQVTLTAEERQGLAEWISANQLSWLQVEFGTQRQAYHRVYRRMPGKPMLWSCLIHDPCLANLRQLAMLGLWKSREAGDEGRVEEAVRHCLTVARVGAHAQTNAFLIEQLVGLAVCGGAAREVTRIVATREMSASQLAQLHSQLADVYRGGFPCVKYDGDRLAVLDKVEYEFTRGWMGGGHHVVGSFEQEFMSGENPRSLPRGPFGTIYTYMDVGLSMIHVGRHKTVARIEQVYDRMNELAHLSPWQRHVQNTASTSATVDWRYTFVYMGVPAEVRVTHLKCRAKAEYEAALTVVALARYHRETGSYPPSLQGLVDAGYLESMPMDPYSDKRLVYRLMDDGFCLYSVSENFTDDGGVMGKDKEGTPHLWQDNGDTIFWPVALQDSLEPDDDGIYR